MQRHRNLRRTALASAAVMAAASSAAAGEFDASGAFSFDGGAVLAMDFASFSQAPDASSGSAKLEADSSALAGSNVLAVRLEGKGYPIPLDLPELEGSYRLVFFMKGDCVAGAAVDYEDGSPGTVSQAFPTGRVTSDGWIEMSTQPFFVDGKKAGVDARMFLSAYARDKPTSVVIDAVEVVPDGSFSKPKACSGLDSAGTCGAGEMCLAGLCRDARGWFPPLPAEAERAKLAQYWKQKLNDTFGVYELRRTTMPGALALFDQMSGAKDNVAFWSPLMEAIRRLRDAHTYADANAVSELPLPRPLNVCFFEGSADLSQAAAPSTPGLPDILVSHAGSSETWGLGQGDRLVKIDGEHPLSWARKLMAPSLWYWEADDPEQIANIVALLRELIAIHAQSIGVVRCDASAGSCNASVDTIEIAELPTVSASAAPKLVKCDNRPFYSVAGANEDHDFGGGLGSVDKVLYGPVLDATPSEAIQGLIWNSLMGDGQSWPLDIALKKAVAAFTTSRGVLLDHRQGHGGTAPTANILIGFARTPYTPFINEARNRASDEGPVDTAAAVQRFNQFKGKGDVFGSTGAQTDIPVALLTTWDVSASDYLLKIMQGGPKVRLFGPGPSMGAFGTFMQYSTWGVMRWSVGIEDAIGPDGTLLSTRGVDPDELVVPKQSDLLAGKDTVHEAAMAWLRTELKP
jgi:hypothetical protein